MTGLIAKPDCKCLAASSTRLLAYINRATQQISLRIDALAARSPNLIPESLVVQVACRPKSDWGCRRTLRQVLFSMAVRSSHQRRYFVGDGQCGWVGPADLICGTGAPALYHPSLVSQQNQRVRVSLGLALTARRPPPLGARSDLLTGRVQPDTLPNTASLKRISLRPIAILSGKICQSGSIRDSDFFID
jgi:hypothetical protein